MPTAEGAESQTETPPEVETFYTFTIQRRQGGPRGAGRRGGEARDGEKPQGERRGKGKRPPKGGKPRGPREDKPRQYSAKPEKKADPDSPFAILQKLKS